MKKSLLIILFLVCNNTFAQLLWQISGNNLKAPSYLFGTIHIGNPKVFNFPDSMEICWKKCSVMAGEINLLNINLTDLMPKLYMPGDTTLAQLLDSTRYQIIKKAISTKLGFFAMFADRIKPIYLASLFADAQNQGSNKNPPLDMYLQATSNARNQTVIGLENVSEQFEALDRISLVSQANMLFETVADFEGDKPSEFEILLESYLKGDIENMYRITTEKLDPTSIYALLTRRNQRMVNRLSKHLAEDKTVFAAVGSGHLAGPEGMIALLRKKGYHLRAVGVKKN